jgi:hypothetical protein
MVEQLISSGRIVDLIVCVMIVEGLLLTVLQRRLGFELPLSRIIPMLLAGLFLLLALRVSLQGGSWTWIALWLLAALIAHMLDLVARLRSAPAANQAS